MKIFVDLSLTPAAIEVLRRGTQGHELLLPPTPAASVLAKADPDPQINFADIAFGQPDAQAVLSASALKWVQISSSGITRYDTPDFRAQMAARKIPLTNSAGVYNEACATHVLSFILAQARNLPTALPSRAANGAEEWNALRQSSSTLRGESALILGYGAIGARLAELLAPFGMKITGFRRKARGDEKVGIVTETALMPALKAADHVVNILPESAQTQHFFDDTRFESMKDGAVFYNIGRGKTVNQEALLRALRPGRLKAAWLDVTDPEPLPDDHPLRQQPNCFITPHIAGGHPDEVVSLVRHFLENFNRYTKGEPLVDRCM
jgi:phosphoglycerate dehydrogenase-like enzyme